MQLFMAIYLEKNWKKLFCQKLKMILILQIFIGPDGQCDKIWVLDEFAKRQ